MAFRRATLKGGWWKKFMNSLQYCLYCSRPLIRRYVKEEKKWRHCCSGCQQITYVNPRIVTGVVPVTSEGKIILLRRNIEPAKGYWTFPSGYMELQETVEEAAMRETKEEVGVDVKLTKLIGIYSYHDAMSVTLVYEGIVPERQRPCLTPEAMEVETFSPSRIPWKMLAFRSVTDALKDWKRSTKLSK